MGGAAGQPIPDEGRHSNGPGGLESPPAGKIACHTLVQRDQALQARYQVVDRERLDHILGNPQFRTAHDI